MFVLSSYTAVLIGFKHWSYATGVERLYISTAVYVALWFIIFERLGLYRRTHALSMRDELYYTVTALSLGVLPQLTLFTIVPGISTSRIVLLLSLAFSIVSVGTTRTVLHGLRTASMMRRRRRIAIVGRSDRAISAASQLAIREEAEQLIIPVDDLDQMIEDINLTRDGELERIPWFRRAREWHCDTLLLTDVVPPSVMPHLLEVTARHNILFAFAPPRIQSHAYSLSLRTDGHQVLIVPSQLRACTPRARLAKRLFDVAFACVAIALAAPVMLLAALAVWIETGSPIIYRQKRVGLRGKVFDIFKFRSMRIDAESTSGAVWAKPGDERTTRVGALLRRTSLDELPQLLNVLRGEMSLVGPRPERPVFVERFRRELPRYDERHLVPPGITGWSQV
ncbi:MAG: exopolysaccharide biosynthesis polyprenyl glycosylphosphotransferase, partial [bacterium]|nr:exopolysaccharide biosynthesis polyprenyl glycosylphosphotransferase [bacterium]